jgi:SAM-dependent methyltransferase
MFVFFKKAIKKILILLGLSDCFIWRLEKKNRQINLNKFSLKFDEFKELSEKSDKRFSLKWNDRFPCLSDNTINTDFDTHYIYHIAWAARILKQTKPEFHTDISSSLFFIAIISAFIPVKFYDYRPANLKLSGLSCDKADLLSLPFSDNSVKSLSCMHTIEHIGLGRYGDNLDYDGDLKAIKELKRVLTIGGNLLFVVPVGKPKIIFNAHRIYSYDMIMEYFSDFKLKEFSLIHDNALETGMIKNADREIANNQNYGCGCFWFTK